MPRNVPAVWLNKRALTLLELPLPHSLTATPQGWQVEFSTTGDMVARFLHGGEHKIGVIAGDRLVASGEELYFTPSE